VQIESATNQAALHGRPRVGPRALLGLVAGIACGLLVGLIALRANLHVVRRADLFGLGTLEEIELFGRFTVYRAPEAATQTDILNGFLLIAIASASFFVALLLSTAKRIERGFLCFLVAALGATYLAADEVLGLHETFGANLRFLGDLPGIRHPDDVLFAAYSVPAAVFAYCFRAVLFSSRPILVVLAAGASLYLLGAALDVTSLPFEEYVEPLASAALLAGFVSLGYRQIELRGKDAHS
jgi:hypothetical protein